MTRITLGLAGAVGHDPAAALFVDGSLVAAVEEERMVRRRHAKAEQPYQAARQCLRIAGLRVTDITHVAIPHAPTSLLGPARWHYAMRHWYAPDRSVAALYNGNRRYRRYLQEVRKLLEQLQIQPADITLDSVPHLLAHASSGYLMAPESDKAAIFVLDAKADYASMFLGYGENGQLHRIKEFYNPDSLPGMYSALTDYLGFEILDGEFKVMGIAPFGDPNRYDLSELARFNGRDFRVNTTLITTVGLRRYKAKSRGHYFSQRLVNRLGPRRAGHLLEDPYVHYAAGIQKLHEDIAVGLVVHYLNDVLKESGKLVVAGTGALNIRLNRRLNGLAPVESLIVHPACGDSGTAIGAAAYAINKAGIPLEPLRHLYLGPSFTREECIAACRNHRDKPKWEQLDDPHERAADLLANGDIVAWFRGAMEFGPRALGHRSLFANPGIQGINEKINKQVKFREHWRPYSPCILEDDAREHLPANCQDEFMMLSVPASEAWRERFPVLIDEDGSMRVQVVKQANSPDCHHLLSCFRQRTGFGLLINASLCRPGEALVCTPEDAVNMFMGTDLDYMIMEDLLISKRAEPEDW